MTLELSKIDTEIAKLQSVINMRDGRITKAIKNLDKLKKDQQKSVEKQKSLQAAKVNISKFNKAG